MADPTLVADSSTVGDDVEYTPPVVQGLTMNALLNPQAEPWSINAGASIAAMSPNPSMSQVVVAGREVLKIFSTESLAEVHNIRFGRVNMLYSSNDVRWNPNESHSHYIATAATNGAVVIWNLNMKGKKLERSMADHTRTVNRIVWQPREPNNLMSGSQDGLMKLWDVRDPSKCQTFDAQSEVRDVQFSPFYPFYFASALENGNILIWDLRKSQPERRITAHTGLIGALAWHPLEKNTLASGGRDRMIKTWDLTAGLKPSSMTQTIAFVGRLTWRPGSHGKPWHIASSAGSTDNSVHIWDTKKPFTPMASLQGSRDVTTSHFWTDNNNIVASSKDGCIRIFNLAKHAYIPTRHIAGTAVRFSVRNHVTVVHEPIDRKSNPVALELAPGQKPDAAALQALFVAGPAFTPIDPTLSATARFGDFIPPVSPYRVSSSPSSTHQNGSLVKSYQQQQQLLQQQQQYHYPHHATNLVPIPAFRPQQEHDDRFGFDPAVFQFLAENYVYHGGDRLTALCEHNANVATEAQAPQLAQMWRMLGLIFTPSEDFLLSAMGPMAGKGGAGGAGGALTLEHGLIDAKSLERERFDKFVNAEGGRNDLHGGSSLAGGSGTGLGGAGSHNGGLLGIPSGGGGVDPLGISSTTAIPIEFSGVGGGGVNSDAAPSPAGGTGTRSVEMFSPLPDDWDLHLLDVPYATSGQQHPGFSGANHHGRSDRAALSLEFGAFDHQSGFTDHDFVEEFDHPHRGMGLGGGVGGNTGGGISGGAFDSDELAPLGSHSRLNGDSLPCHAFGSAFAALQAASILENQQDWEASSVVHDILNFHENSGDVQTCVFVGLVLQDVITIEPRRMLAWMIAYIELLHRLQLWNCANSLAKHCHLDSIRNMSKQGTTIYTKCANCNKAILGNSGVYCENCKKATSTCALCRLPVKGSLVWCPGCGHGGHSHHMSEWFATETHCPTGCGHICLFSPPPPPSTSTGSTPTVLSASGSRTASPAPGPK